MQLALAIVLLPTYISEVRLWSFYVYTVYGTADYSA